MMDKIPPTSSAQPVVPLPISTVVSTSKPQSHVFVWIAAGVVTLAIGIGIGLAVGKYSSKAQISSYDDCVKAKGSRIQESYPATCVTAGGQRFTQPVSAPTATPTEITDPTANWKTYTNTSSGISFKYPGDWGEQTSVIGGSSTTQDIKDKNNFYTLAFDIRSNYNQNTGKPYSSIQEFAGFPYQGNILMLDGSEGHQYLPRAGSENDNSVNFFSRDLKAIYTIELDVGNSAISER